jgi:HAD superfamily hydrolase (TIGR01509 family)
MKSHAEPTPCRHPPEPFAAALFDFDGTLFDTDPVHWTCWNAALEPFGAALDRHTYNTTCAGRATMHIAEHLVRETGLPATPEEVAHRKEQAYRAWLSEEEVAWMPGAESCFRRLQARGCRLAVVTSGPRADVTLGLTQRAILQDLDVLITREDVPRSKPAPDCYHLCLERLGLPASACLAFEDTTSGLRAALGAGLRCVVVRPPHAGPQDLACAHRVFDNWQAAADWALGPCQAPQVNNARA